jgi:hypothetical protein
LTCQKENELEALGFGLVFGFGGGACFGWDTTPTPDPDFW